MKRVDVGRLLEYGPAMALESQIGVTGDHPKLVSIPYSCRINVVLAYKPAYTQTG